MIVLHFIPAEGVLRFALYLIPYGIIGYDILRKAWKGIRNRRVFDENFLMAVATIGALILGLIDNADVRDQMRAKARGLAQDKAASVLADRVEEAAARR